MATGNKLAVVGHAGWAAKSIVKALAEASPQPVRILHRKGSDINQLPSNTETVEISYDDEGSIAKALEGVDTLISLIGHEGLHMQKKFLGPMKKAGVKLFAPSDLALPYTSDERATVAVPRMKEELEHELKGADFPFVTVCIGNFTSFALGSPYMGIDIPNQRIVYTEGSERNPVYLCSRDYAAAGYVSLFVETSPEKLANRTIGLNELKPTSHEIALAMEKRYGKPPRTAVESLDRMREEAKAGDLAALVRKKMGDGTHGVGDDIWDLLEFPKATITDFIVGKRLEQEEPYIPWSDDTLHYLDKYFE